MSPFQKEKRAWAILLPQLRHRHTSASLMGATQCGKQVSGPRLGLQLSPLLPGSTVPPEEL